MPENSVFIRGVLLMAFSAGVFAQPVTAVPPSAAVMPALSATSARQPSAAAVSSQGPADASETVPIFPGDSVTGGQLEALQGKTLLLEAQVQAARLQKELTSAQTPGEAGPVPAAGSFVTGMPAGMSTAPVPASPATGRITVLEVSGRGNALQATLSFPDGRQSQVQTGSVVPGTSLKVKAITLSSVTLSDGQQLTF
ncbi:type IV pilus biogenesis protein PilP [Salmonella enterica subsp. enterica]|nr:type IV pilus biogenesis protein PilP [Salmonella enterica subsp. enterica serovar Hvittingfoss]